MGNNLLNEGIILCFDSLGLKEREEHFIRGKELITGVARHLFKEGSANSLSTFKFINLTAGGTTTITMTFYVLELHVLLYGIKATTNPPTNQPTNLLTITNYHSLFYLFPTTNNH